MSTRSSFVLGTQVCPSLSEGGAADREWLLTDGTGGFATGTAAGLRTRRAHSFLVTPAGAVTLAALDPVLTLPSGTRVELAVHEWESRAVAPRGHTLLASFDLTDGLPRWRWRVGDVVVERELAMEHGRNAVGVVHRIVAAPEPVRLTLGALCLWHQDIDVTPVSDGVTVDDTYRIAGPGWRPSGNRYFGAYTRRDAADGRPPTHDLWHAGIFVATLRTGETLEVCAWSGDLSAPPPPATVVVAAARKRARKVILAAKPADHVDGQLALAADAFIVKGGVVSGYPDGSLSTVDTFPAYEGLFLETGRAAEGRALLRGYADEVPDTDNRRPADPAQVPAHEQSLWYVHAVERHIARTGDSDLCAALLPTLDAIALRYADRTDPADGLLARHPEPGALTWLDGRYGKPVDLNALWVNALGAPARLRESIGRDASDLYTAHETARTGFTKRFVTPAGWLYDLVDAPPPPYPLAANQPYDDPALRPLQLLAWALPYGPATDTGPEPLRAVSAGLLTPLGPRSLAPTESGYQPDAQAQGAVWPWFVAAYAAACRTTGLRTDGLLDGFDAHLGEYGIGSVCEYAHGDPPHRPAGAPFHARSVAEYLRARRLLAPPARPRATKRV
jgi:hypothetical protein